MRLFEVISPFQPAGDQGEAIAVLSDGIKAGDKYQTLQGVQVPAKPLPWQKLLKQFKCLH